MKHAKLDSHELAEIFATRHPCILDVLLGSYCFVHYKLYNLNMFGDSTLCTSLGFTANVFVSLSIYLSIYLFIYLSIYLSFYLPVCLFIINPMSYSTNRTRYCIMEQKAALTLAFSALLRWVQCPKWKRKWSNGTVNGKSTRRPVLLGGTFGRSLGPQRQVFGFGFPIKRDPWKLRSFQA